MRRENPNANFEQMQSNFKVGEALKSFMSIKGQINTMEYIGFDDKSARANFTLSSYEIMHMSYCTLNGAH